MCGLVVLLFCGFVVRLLVKQKEEQESATASARFFTFPFSLFTFHFSPPGEGCLPQLLQPTTAALQVFAAAIAT